jgi:hypothetical protein
MASFDSPKIKSTPGTPDSTAPTIPDTESFQGSPTNEYCQNLETINEQLLREIRILKQELDYYRPKPGDTPSTVLQIKDKNTVDEYYAWDLVPYTTKHRDQNFPVVNAQGETIGTVNTDNELAYDFEAEHRQSIGSKQKKTAIKSTKKSVKKKPEKGGNKKSCKRTKKH